MPDPTLPTPSESPAAHQALLDYLRLGPGRSLPALLQRYRNQENPPTASLHTLRKWSSRFGWPARASSFDDLEDQRTQAEYRAHREALMQTGLALEHERVERLTSWFEKLDTLTHTDEALWIKEVKTLRLEDGHFERVELRRFNDDLFRLLLGILQAIASETGGRSRPSQLNQPQKPALNLQDVSLDKLLPAERSELDRLMSKIFS